MSADTAASVAFDPSAPRDEQQAALTELQAAYVPSLQSELLDQSAIRQFAEELKAEYEAMEAETSLVKSMNDTPVPFPSRNLREKRPGMHSAVVDDLQVVVSGDYIERPGMVQFEGMRAMVEETPILNAIINTRVRQVQRFCRIAESGELPGFEVRLVDRERQLTDQQREQKQMIQKFMLHCGFEFDPFKRKALKRDNFKALMSKSVRDALTMDSAPIELEWKNDPRKGLDGFYAVDGATIRLCSELGFEGDESIYALQVVGGRITTAYSFRDLLYEPRNPRTDVRACGYGLSEVETLVRVVTGLLNAMTYNVKGFDSNSIPKGILHMVGNYQQADVTAFKRMWNAQVRGVQNAWGLPIMISPDEKSKVQFEKIGNEFNEMHFSKWMTFLTSIACAIFGMSPAEINFDSFTAGSSSALSGSDTGEKLAASKDSGLYPLLTHFGDVWSDFIVPRFGDEWCFRWTGLEPDDADKRFELKKAVQTVDEARAELGLVKHPDPMLGAAPLNQALTGLYTQINQDKLGPPPDMGQPGAAGAGGDAGKPPKGGAGTDFGDQADKGDFGDEGDEGYGHAKKGDFGASGQGGTGDKADSDFGAPPRPGEDFGKAFPDVYEVQL
jgi:hypothetical protein